jgi:CheY-like chemotaxis protein
MEKTPVTTANRVKRVLIADPSEEERQTLGLFLREKGLDVVEVGDGSKALSETLLRRPDVLLIDLSITLLDAERLVQILRANPNTKSIPIFFLSDREKSVSGFRQGFDAFIRKPFHEEEMLLKIQRTLFQDPLGDSLSGDSEISGSISQVSIPDLWQMLSLNRKSGIIQVDGEGLSGSIYIEKGEIVSAVSRNTSGEKALFRIVPLKEGRFRFIPGRVNVRRTVHAPGQHVILEGLRHFDELRKIKDQLPAPGDAIVVLEDARVLAGAGGIVREVLLLAECCSKVEDIVDNCDAPDLPVYDTLLMLKKRSAVRIGPLEARTAKSDFLPPEALARLCARLDERKVTDGRVAGRIVLFLPDAALLEAVVLALGRYREFEVDKAFFSLRRGAGTPIGLFGRIRAGETGVLSLYSFSYLRSTSPAWYALAPRPIGIVAFLKDEVSSSLEGLMAVSDYTRGTDARVVLAVMGKTFTNFGLGENTVRLFQNRIEKLGCSLKVQEMDRLSSEEIRDALARVVRQYLEGGSP